MSHIKCNSFQTLASLVNAEKTQPAKWLSFLAKKGHTEQTFSYLPEDIKTALKFSFAKNSHLY